MKTLMLCLVFSCNLNYLGYLFLKHIKVEYFYENQHKVHRTKNRFLKSVNLVDFSFKGVRLFVSLYRFLPYSV